MPSKYFSNLKITLLLGIWVLNDKYVTLPERKEA